MTATEPELSPRPRPIVAALVVGIASIGATAFAVVLARRSGGVGSTFDSLACLGTTGIVLAAASLGTRAIAHGRRQGLGWVFVGLGFGLSISLLAREYARYALGVGHWHALPIDWVALSGELVLVAALLAAPVSLLAEGGRWRLRGWRYATLLLLGVALISLTLL